MQRTSINSFKYMRIIACFGIVVLHTLFSSKVYFNLSESNYMWVDIFQNLFMWAVPFFLMITGALLLNPQKDLGKERLIKYLLRIGIALIAFTFIYQLLDSIYEPGSFNFFEMLKTWGYKLLTGQSWAPTWYLYLMIGLYLMIPFYKMVTKHASMNQIGLLIILLIVFVSIIPLIKIKGESLGFYIPTGIIYPCYLFLGYYVFNKEMPKWIYAILFVVGTVVIVLTTFTDFMKLANFKDDLSLGYENIFVIVQSVGLFGLLKDIKLKPSRVVEEFDKATFGIYLIHIILVKMIFKWLGFNPFDYAKGWWLLLVIGIDLGIFILSFGVSAFIRTISKDKLL